MSKFHNDWIKIQREIASDKNVSRIISLKFRCKINIFGHSPNIIITQIIVSSETVTQASMSHWLRCCRVIIVFESMLSGKFGIVVVHNYTVIKTVQMSEVRQATVNKIPFKVIQ